MRFPIDNFNEIFNETNQFGLEVGPDMWAYYPLTHTHIGTDFKVPSGSPIYAPCDGTMLKPVVSAPKGNVGLFDFVAPDGSSWIIELCHLSRAVREGKYREGDIIGYSGNTGSATTGAHLHTVLHRDGRVTRNYSDISSEGHKGWNYGRAKFNELFNSGRLADTHAKFNEWVKPQS